MWGRAQRISEVVKRYDSALYAVAAPKGIQVHRRLEKYVAPTADVNGSSTQSLFILALTDTWHLSGTPVDWGVEPLMLELRSRDQWNQDRAFDEMIRRREAMEADRIRGRKNQFRAVAADMRREFAEATNDIVVRK